MSRGLRALRDAPETNVALFAFLLNFPWEFLQVPFYSQLETTPHWQAVEMCSRAALGDVGIALIAFWGVSAAASRRWPLRPTASQLGGFLAIGLAITMVIEWLSTRVLGRWSYAPEMPTLPLTGTGLLPILQWIVLPPLLVWFVRRQLT